jgi:hypothetical protein
MAQPTMEFASLGKSKKRQRETVSEQDELVETPVKKTARQKQFEAGESTLEQAQPYRIATARMPIDALTPVWSLNQNRPVSERHVQKLCTIFMQGGLNRTARGNHLQVLCSQEQIRKMMAHLNVDVGSGKSMAVDEIMDFAEWKSVIGDRKLEILAGQHRIRALEEYVKQTNAGDGELWWPCEFYDEGKRSTHCRQGKNNSTAGDEATDKHHRDQILCHAS